MLPSLSNLTIGLSADGWQQKKKKMGRERPVLRRVVAHRSAHDDTVYKRFKLIITRYERSDHSDAAAVRAIEELRKYLIGLHGAGWVVRTLFRDADLSELVIGVVRGFVELVHADQQSVRAMAYAARMKAATELPRGTELEQVQRRAAIAWVTVQDPANTRLSNEVTKQASELLGALPAGWKPADNNFRAHVATQRASERLRGRSGLYLNPTDKNV